MFDSRQQAGHLLSKELLDFQKSGVIVLAIPRGGVPVAKEISNALHLPLGLVITKKVGAPEHEELAIGAVGPQGEVVLDRELIARLGISPEETDQQIQKSKAKVAKYKSKFKASNLNPKAKTVLLVDDGIATGATLEVAIKHLRNQKVKKIILAIPVVPPEAVPKFKILVDNLLILETPVNFKAVGQFYRTFPQVSDAEVLQLLQ